MKLFRKLFAEKILRYYEGTEAGIKIIKKLPILKKLVKEESFGEKSKSRAFIGALAQAFMLAWEFIRKFLYQLSYDLGHSRGYINNISVYNAFNNMWKPCQYYYFCNG